MMKTRYLLILLFILKAIKTPAQWQQVNTPSFSPRCLAAQDSVLIAGTEGPVSPVYISTDRGNSWTPANGLLEETTVLSMAVNDSGIYAGYYDNFMGG